MIFQKKGLEGKIQFFIENYNATVRDSNYNNKDVIKWDRELNKYKERGIVKEFVASSLIRSVYRPFVKEFFYFDKHFNGMTYQWPNIFKPTENRFISVPGLASPKDFHCYSFDSIIDLNAMPAGGQNIPLFCYESKGKIDNITDWGLDQFTKKFKDKKITKDDIFHYVYGVLHNPAYREKYALNLKRDFPRIPFYNNFWEWVKWGKQLMELHINYETVKPFALKEVMKDVENPKTKLKADKAAGSIMLDEATTLTGIPADAWEYKLGNRSAIEWILDQYKESKPKDPTIAEKFNTYRFADYKEQVIDLIKRVTTVSVETMKIIDEMKKQPS